MGPIEYAPPHVADAKPPFIADPEIEALIDRNAPFDEIADHFWLTSRAVRYVARSIAARFPAHAAGDRCEICGAPTDDLIYARWRFAHDGRSYRGRTETCHAMCDPCSRRCR